MNSRFRNQSDNDFGDDFQDLKKKYEALSELYNKTITDQNLSDTALSRLNKFSVELLNMAPLDNLEVAITRMIKDITGAKAAVFSGYDPVHKSLNVQHIELEPGLLNKALALIGQQANKISAPVSNEMYNLMVNEMIGYRDTLHEASFGSIPKPVSLAVQKLLRVDRFIGIVYLVDSKFYGTTLLAMGKGQPDPPRLILENIIFLAAVTLKRKRSEEAALDSEERFRILFEGSPDAIFLTDPINYQVLYANKAASSLLQKKNEEVTGLNLYELHNNQPPEYMRSTYDRLSRESEFAGVTRPFESSIVRSDGNIIPVELSVQTIFYKCHKVLMSSFRDISERKQAEYFMHQLLSESQTLIDNIQQGVLLENENRIIQFANKKFCELFGISSPKDIQGVDCMLLAQQAKWYFKEPEVFISTIENRLKQQTVVLSEEIILTDGRVMERDFIPVIIDGKKCKNYWVYRDISERKQAETTLRESQLQVSALLKAIPDMLFIQTPDGKYINYQAPDNSPLYLPPEVFIGKNMNELLPADLVNEFWKVFVNAMETRMVQNFEYSLPMPDGPAYFESRTVAYASDKILSLVRDITERKKAEVKIQLQVQELKKINEDKDRFMSILAHDLKSPFNSILGLLRLLSENLHRYDLPKIQKLIGTIKYSSEHFYQLLESLLLWARAQSGKMPFEPQLVDFSVLCREVIAEVSLNADAKNISIDFGSASNDEVFADVEMLKTILRNLISNAIKFTHPGGLVQVIVTDNVDKTIVEVVDNGVGLSDEKLGTLFDISSSHKLKGTAGETGTGLGLFLCRDLVEKHGGRIKAESVPEQGSRFIFTLPKPEIHVSPGTIK